MTDQTGFHDIPWDVDSANGGSLDGLPAAPERFYGSVCRAEWAGTAPTHNADPWGCTRRQGHTGTHRAGDSIATVAEWRDADAAAAVTR